MENPVREKVKQLIKESILKTPSRGYVVATFSRGNRRYGLIVTRIFSELVKEGFLKVSCKSVIGNNIYVLNRGEI